MLRPAWEQSTPRSRAALAPKLEAHLAAFPNDPTGRAARAWLALIAVERGDRASASRNAALVLVGPEGTTRDVAAVAFAAVRRLGGEASAAFDALQPMAGRLVDPAARWIVHRELVLAAIDASRFREAARELRRLLQVAPASAREPTLEEAQRLIERMPASELVALLGDEVRAQEPTANLVALLSRHTSRVALDRADIELARDLLATGAALDEDVADALEKLAAQGAEVRVERDAVGLLVPLRSAELGERAVAVAAALTHALGGATARTRLLSRDDGGSSAGIEPALDALARDGASIVVGGIDREESDRLVAFSMRTGIAVLLVSPPSSPPAATGRAFVIGDEGLAARTALVRAFASRGDRPVALLVEDPLGDVVAGIDPGLVVATQPCGAGLDFARRAGARALVVDPSPRCLAGLGELALPVGVVLGAHPTGLRGLVATSTNLEVANDPDYARWIGEGRRAPGWWSLLGHDAGALARAALAGLARDPSSLEAQRAAIASALAASDVGLWSTSARGFAGGRLLPRDVRVVDAKSP